LKNKFFKKYPLPLGERVGVRGRKKEKSYTYKVYHEEKQIKVARKKIVFSL